MRSRIAALVIAFGAIGFATGAYSLPSFTSAESKVPTNPGTTGAGTEASVGVASAFEDTCSLLGRQQTGQGCESVAAPTGTPGSLAEAIDALVASIRGMLDLVRQQIPAQIELPPAVLKQAPAAQPASEPAGSTPPAAAQTNQSPLQDEVKALQDAFQQHIQSQLEKALTGMEPSTTTLGGSAPGCTMEQDVGGNSIRTTVSCSQRQVSTNGSSSTSSVQTSSSSSVSVSSTSSSDSR